MSIGFFTDKNNIPSEKDYFTAIGSKMKIWEALVKFIRNNYQVNEDYHFQYGKKYGWALRFQINKKFFTCLYPTLNGFTVQIILNNYSINKAIELKPGNNVMEAINNAFPYPEGRWLFIPIETKSDLNDIRFLLTLRHEMIQK